MAESESENSNPKSLIATVIATAVGAAIAFAGSDGGETTAGGWPIFALCAGLAFAINWVAFIPSAIARSERIYDLTGGITYLSVTSVAVLLSSDLDLRGQLVAAGVILWATRLASFLFMRIMKDGKDGRFDEMKTNPITFLMAWTLQGLWVLLTAAAALAVITGGERQPLGVIGAIGIAVWAAGFAVEALADAQKSRFKADPANHGKFIDTGLWAWSRHPNYFGEIVIWVGMAIIALPVLQGWQYATLISPVFVAFLLIKVSGIPMLEERADARWGGQGDYEKYKAATPVLVLKPPSRSA
ncbi:MAG: DUF1295 domain-containing protein [Pseudomonadota bacterium]